MGTMGAKLSIDGGKTWITERDLSVLINKQNLHWVRKLQNIPAEARDSKGRLYQCAKDGTRVTISDNLGKNWLAMEKLDKTDDERRVVKYSFPRIDTSGGGIRLVRDGKAYYPDLNGQLREEQEIRTLAHGIDICEEVLVIADKPYVLAQNGIYTSNNRGKNWTGVYHRLGQPLVSFGFRMFGDQKGNLYVNKNNSGGIVHAYSSKDEGNSWNKMLFGFTEKEIGDRRMAIFSMRGNAFYFIVDGAGGKPCALYKSDDGVSHRLLLTFDRETIPTYIFSIIDFANQQIAVLGDRKLYLSSDDGLTWKTIGAKELNLH